MGEPYDDRLGFAYACCLEHMVDVRGQFLDNRAWLPIGANHLDFPGVGFVCKERIAPAQAALARVDVDKIEDDDVRASVQSLLDWLTLCVLVKRDLICFYTDADRRERTSAKPSLGAAVFLSHFWPRSYHFWRTGDVGALLGLWMTSRRPRLVALAQRGDKDNGKAHPRRPECHVRARDRGPR
ncbi:MAG TPA: hypothetical protein VIF57_25225 [Polyangia bacterium]|jgi:hypothetical protein